MLPACNTCNQNFEEAKLITWFEVGLRHEAIRLSKKHQRLLKHELLILNQPVRFNDEDNNVELIDTFHETNELGKLLVKNDPCYEVESSIFIQEMLTPLTRQQKRVIIEIVLEGRTEIEAAKRLGVSQPAVHKMKERALNVLRERYCVDKS